MTSQPGNVRIITNDPNVRSGTTTPSETVLRLSTITLTNDDLDRLATAMADRLVGGTVIPAKTSDPDYVPVKRNSDQRPMSEY